MPYRTIVGLFLIIGLLVAACTPQTASTPTPAPTQTPFILVVTATASFTPTASPTPTATPTPTPTSSPTPRPQESILDRCVLRTDWQRYTVVAGDTLSNLAARTNTTVTTLQLANCIPDRNRIQVGQRLYVPELPDDDPSDVQELITSFSVTPSEAEAGDTVTFSWEAEEDTVVEIKHVTGNNAIIGSNLAATGSLTYRLPTNLGDLTQLEFVANGIKEDDDGDILATPYSVFIDIVEPPEETDEPEITDEPDITEEPEETDEPDMTEEPEATDEP